MDALGLLTTGLVFGAVAHAAAVLLLAADHLAGRSRVLEVCGPAMTLGAGALVAAAVTKDITGVAVLGGLLVPATLAGVLGLRSFRVSGALLCATYVAFLAFALPWTGWFVATLPVSTPTRVLMLAAAPLLVLVLPINLVRTFENWEVLCRRHWRRPRRPLVEPDRSHFTRVSVHVPAHAEPPEVVIATLDALAKLDYPNFEVLVIDNNTTDPALWCPVEEHCSALGESFRFFHVEGLAGAKAGALNFALAHTDPQAELVAVVDADYQVDPDFLSGTVGHFDNPAMGFVQGPHAYRDWADSSYLSICNWEYAYFFGTGMVSRNERDAAITVGTMSVIRRRALEEAGGWAEWCLTEDSELAVRIRALGYSSVYLTHVYGRGLIPETFAGYKQQRFRWTFGPVQELKRHWRLYLPRRWRHPSRLTTAQRIHDATHGLYGISTGLGIASAPLAIAVLGSMALHGEVVKVPFPLWVAATVLLLGNLALRWLTYRVVLGARLREALGAFLASSALSHVVVVASLWGLVGREVPWRRTNKFRARSCGITALATVRTELVLGLSYLALAAAVVVALPHAGVAVMLAIGVMLQGATYLAAPAMALIADRDLRRALDRDALGSVGHAAPLRAG
jgi:cellulose synthase/poly-beta-1,6-N-acetylglucosamine synthase-like glycosyltransferase